MSETLEIPDVIAEALAAVKIPKWAVDATEWHFDVDGSACREVYGPDHDVHPCHVESGEPFSGVVRVTEWQTTAGEREQYVLLNSSEGLLDLTAESARSLAQALIEAADELDGPTPAEIGRQVGELQAQIIRAVRGHLTRLDMHQDQLAIAAGYGTDEMSAIMTGRRLADVVDIWRIAGALEVDPVGLFEPDADEQ